METNIIDLNQLTENTDQALAFLEVFSEGLVHHNESQNALRGSDVGNGLILLNIALGGELQCAKDRLDAAHGETNNRTFTFETAPAPIRDAVRELSAKLRMAAAMAHIMARAAGCHTDFNSGDSNLKGLPDGYEGLAGWSAEQVLRGLPAALARSSNAQMDREKAAREPQSNVSA